MDVFYTRPARLREGWSAGRSYCFEGVTVLELLITLSVFGILLAIAVPSYTTLVTSTRIAAHHNALVGDLAFTRSEAVKRNRQVVICLSSDGANCGSGDRWDQGWIVFVDLDGDHEPDSDEPVLRRQGRLTDIELTYGAFGSERYIPYYPDGSTRHSNGTFSFCPKGHAGAGRALILAKTGRVRSSQTKRDGSPPCS